jgi:serine/threonine protein kinase
VHLRAASDPRLMADLLLFSLLESDAELLELAPVHDERHMVSLTLSRGPLGCLELNSDLADAVAARLALIAGLDFTSGEDRHGRIALELGGKSREVHVSLRARGGHLSVELRRPGTMRAYQRTSSLEKPASVADYVLLDELGRGALGVVYRAKHRLLGREAAVKIWSLPNTSLGRANAALLREARAAAATRHPGVVEVYDVLHLEDGRVAMVMELLHGETLAARIMRVNALTPGEALDVAVRVVEVMEATQAHGIVHRDIKPDNVFLTLDGRVKVLDFGAAMHEAHGDERPGTLGTPWYMAPEQAEGGKPDRRGDIYSFGCVLYEMLTGRCPFDHQDPRIVILRHREDPVPVPASPYGALPEALERTIQRALDKRPEGRQQSAAELLAELRAVMFAMQRPGFRKWLPL